MHDVANVALDKINFRKEAQENTAKKKERTKATNFEMGRIHDCKYTDSVAWNDSGQKQEGNGKTNARAQSKPAEVLHRSGRSVAKHKNPTVEE